MRTLMFSAYSVFALLLLLPGCAVTAPPPKPIEQAFQDIPVNWQESDSADIDIKKPFFNSLTDLLLHPQLKELVGEAVSENPDLNQLALKVKASGLLLKQVDANRYPTIDLTANSARNRRFESIASSYEYGLNVAWEIDLWGRLADQEESTGADYTAQKWEYAAAENTIAVTIVRIWIEGWALSRIKNIEQNYLDALEKMEVVILENYRNGTVQLEDVSAIRVQQESVHADMIASSELISRNYREMELFLGRVPSNNAVFNNKQLPEVLMPPTAVPAKVLAQRPDIQVAFHQLKAFDAETRARYKALLPSVNLSGSLGQVGNSGTLSNLFKGDTIWSLVGGVTQPLFNAGSIQAQADATAVSAEASWWAYRKTILTAIQEVENALTVERSLNQQLERLLKARNESLEVQLIYKDKYLNGLVDVLDFIESQLQTLEIDARIIQAEAAQMDNRILLALAMGFGIEQEQENEGN